jgi:cyclic pyranopterin phosphate synthase
VPRILDTLQRPLRSLRVSVTDRCNLRCAYCMPEVEYTWLPRADLLTFEELGRLVDVFTGLGADRVRLTGGEPLLRKDLPTFVAQLATRPAIADLALTTNGVLLADMAQPLRDAGLHRVTVSLDTLDRERFRQLTRMDELDRVRAGIDQAAAVFGRLKIDTVVMRGTNDDELVDLLEFGRRIGGEVRFIEYMDVGGATRWRPEAVVSRREMLDHLEAHYGPVTPIVEDSSAPAERFRVPDGLVFGLISSTTAPFCRQCDRARLTADGLWLLCLYATQGLDLRAPLRGGASDDDLVALITARWRARTDRGAEARLETVDRRVWVAADTLRANRHLEMHTRGG